MKFLTLSLFLMVLICLLTDSALVGAEYWISADGSVSATGSYDNPFKSINVALAKVGGSNTFIFKPGYYNEGQINLWPKYSGSPEHPTTLKSQYKYGAVLNGSLYHIIDIKEGCKWVVIDGFEICGAMFTGAKIMGDYCVVRNCRLYFNGFGVQAHDANNIIIIERNLIEFNGKHPQFDHGIYADGNGLIIRNNIIRFNSGCGVHLYPSAVHSLVENNLIYDNHGCGVLFYCPEGGGANRIINNTIADNGSGIIVKNGRDEIIANNIIWQNGNQPSIQPTFGGTLDNVRIVNNILSPKIDTAEENLSNDPLFLNPSKGWYFLKENSPARKNGLTKYMPSNNFFGNERKSNAESYIGCFEFNESLLKVETSRDLYLGWSYYGSPTSPRYDLWNLDIYKTDVNSITMEP